jgi:hypothetical protein
MLLTGASGLPLLKLTMYLSPAPRSPGFTVITYSDVVEHVSSMMPSSWGQECWSMIIPFSHCLHHVFSLCDFAAIPSLTVFFFLDLCRCELDVKFSFHSETTFSVQLKVQHRRSPCFIFTGLYTCFTILLCCFELPCYHSSNHLAIYPSMCCCAGQPNSHSQLSWWHWQSKLRCNKFLLMECPRSAVSDSRNIISLMWLGYARK